MIVNRFCIYYYYYLNCSEIGRSEDVHADAPRAAPPPSQSHQVVRLLVVHPKEFRRGEICRWSARYYRTSLFFFFVNIFFPYFILISMHKLIIKSKTAQIDYLIWHRIVEFNNVHTIPSGSASGTIDIRSLCQIFSVWLNLALVDTNLVPRHATILWNDEKNVVVAIIKCGGTVAHITESCSLLHKILSSSSSSSFPSNPIKKREQFHKYFNTSNLSWSK